MTFCLNPEHLHPASERMDLGLRARSRMGEPAWVPVLTSLVSSSFIAHLLLSLVDRHLRSVQRLRTVLSGRLAHAEAHEAHEERGLAASPPVFEKTFPDVESCMREGRPEQFPPALSGSIEEVAMRYGMSGELFGGENGPETPFPIRIRPAYVGQLRIVSSRDVTRATPPASEVPVCSPLLNRYRRDRFEEAMRAEPGESGTSPEQLRRSRGQTALYAGSRRNDLPGETHCRRPRETRALFLVDRVEGFR